MAIRYKVDILAELKKHGYTSTRIREEKLKKIIELHCEHKLSFQPMTPIDVLVKQRLFMFRYMKVLEQRARYEGIELE